MTIINSTHDGVTLTAHTRGKKIEPSALASYSYLFPTLADDDSASLIANGSVQETRNILADFASKLGVNWPKRGAKLPVVYTYFGQFLNHDISAPTGSMVPSNPQTQQGEFIDIGQDLPGVDKTIRPSSTAPILRVVRNQQQNPMMLNSLYASGPFSDDGSGGLYQPDGVKFALGETNVFNLDDLSQITKFPQSIRQNPTPRPDLKRDWSADRAIIADQRNDENLLISQLHLAFMLFHNKTVDAIKHQYTDDKKLFAAARQLVTWHYQWCIVHDYLKKIVLPPFLQQALRAPSLHKSGNHVPMEFTTAAFRFGHSMVSDQYNFNVNFKAADLVSLFSFTSRGRMNNSTLENKQLPDFWVADWARLALERTDELSGSDQIDTQIAAGMAAMDTPALFGNVQHSSIIARNILRGFHRRIPCGQSLVAALNSAGLPPALKIATLSPTQILTVLPDHETREFAETHGLTTKTPAWYYFLAEAQILSGGKQLGPAASCIIAETIVGLLKSNPASGLNASGGTWTPTKSPLRSPNGAEPIADIASFLRFAGVLA